MKFTISRPPLADALALVAGVVPNRTPKPILTSVIVKAENGVVTLCSSDLERYLSMSISAVDVTDGGVVAIDAKRLLGVVGGSTTETLTFEQTADDLLVTDNAAKFSLRLANHEDMPPMPSVKGGAALTLPGKDIAEAINAVGGTVATDNSRYAICGVLVHGDGKALRFASTHGRALTVRTFKSKANLSAIVPISTLSLVRKLVDGDESDVSVSVGEGVVQFSTDDWRLTSNIIEGNFPPYADVIPKPSGRVATVSRDALVAAVRRATDFTTEATKGIAFVFDGKALTLNSLTPEIGRAEIVVSLSDYVGEPLTIVLAADILLPVITRLGEKIQLDMGAANKPVRFTSGDVMGVVCNIILPSELTLQPA